MNVSIVFACAGVQCMVRIEPIGPCACEIHAYGKYLTYRRMFIGRIEKRSALAIATMNLSITWSRCVLCKLSRTQLRHVATACCQSLKSKLWRQVTVNVQVCPKLCFRQAIGETDEVYVCILRSEYQVWPKLVVVRFFHIMVFEMTNA